MKIIEICCCGMNLIFDSWLTRPHQERPGKDGGEVLTNQRWGQGAEDQSGRRIIQAMYRILAVTRHRPHFKFPHPQFRIGLQAQWRAGRWSQIPHQNIHHGFDLSILCINQKVLFSISEYPLHFSLNAKLMHFQNDKKARLTWLSDSHRD